jgi:hypothetical protein
MKMFYVIYAEAADDDIIAPLKKQDSGHTPRSVD